jgi:hypothetical protein
MIRKTQHVQPAPRIFRYEQEDLAPRDGRAEEAETEAFLERNSASLRASIEQSRTEFDRGESFTFGQVRADIDAQRQNRRTAK